MKIEYMLRLHPYGDIDIIKHIQNTTFYTIVYHKSYNLGESIKQNLINAYEEWKKITKENDDNDII